MNGKPEYFLQIVILTTIQGIQCRDCYNYKEEPRVRSCEYGCCGDDYEEHCCDATLQIVGCVIGGIVLISVIVAIAFFCYRQKSKLRQGSQGNGTGGLLARFGMRSNNTGTGTQQTSRVPVIPTRDIPIIPGNAHMANAQYNPQYVQSVQLAGPPSSGFLYPGNNMYDRPPMAPTAPMPPPYAMTGPAPPPYTINKPIPPPPEYSTVANVGYKHDNYNSMPLPSS